MELSLSCIIVRRLSSKNELEVVNSWEVDIVPLLSSWSSITELNEEDSSLSGSAVRNVMVDPNGFNIVSWISDINIVSFCSELELSVIVIRDE